MISQDDFLETLAVKLDVYTSRADAGTCLHAYACLQVAERVTSFGQFFDWLNGQMDTTELAQSMSSTPDFFDTALDVYTYVGNLAWGLAGEYYEACIVPDDCQGGSQ